MKCSVGRERVRVPAVVISERETRGISLVGIDPQDEKTMSFLGDVTIRGEGLEGRKTTGAFCWVPNSRRASTPTLGGASS